VLKALEDIQQSGRMGALAKTRLDMTSQAISGARNAMNGLSTSAVVALEGGGATGTTFAGADVLLDDIRNIMQTAGSADDIEAAIETYFESPTGGFQTRIYQGSDSDAPPINIGNGQTR